MSTLNEDLAAIKAVEDTITANKVANFAYTDEAYTQNDANGVTEYNVNNAQNIPTADASVLKVNSTILTKGYRAQASSITRMLMNHFLGRLSYNVNKVNDGFANLLSALIKHRGAANGFATLDENGRIPYSQLPESAMEYKGNWNAETNTPELSDEMSGATKGDFYIVSVAGTQDLGSGEIQFSVNDRIIYDGSVWELLTAGSVTSVNNVSPSNGNIRLTGEDIPVSSSDSTLLSTQLTTNRYADSSVTVQKVNFTFKDVMAKTPRWLRFDFSASNKQTLKILADTHIRVGSTVIHFTTDTSFDLSSEINTTTSPNGKDWYVFLDTEGNVTCSLTDAEASGTKRIGQFHTLCVDVGTNVTGIVPTEISNIGFNYLIKRYDAETDPDFYAFYNKKITAITSGSDYNTGTVAHPLSGFSANDILPESVWCLTFHPSCAPYEGMVYDKDCNIAVDIYLQSGKGKSICSVYNGTISVANYLNRICETRALGKRFLKPDEFTSIAIGSNELTAIQGEGEPFTTGGHVDTKGRRMISFIGCEDCCGALRQMLDSYAVGEVLSSPKATDGLGSFGYQDFEGRYISGGGEYAEGSICGSRCFWEEINYSKDANESLATFPSRGSAGVIYM